MLTQPDMRAGNGHDHQGGDVSEISARVIGRMIEMGKDRDDRGDDKPGRHEDDREGQVHEDTAKKIDPSKYGTDDDED